jgi:hypothetical protein
MDPPLQRHRLVVQRIRLVLGRIDGAGAGRDRTDDLPPTRSRLDADHAAYQRISRTHLLAAVPHVYVDEGILCHEWCHAAAAVCLHRWALQALAEPKCLDLRRLAT